MTREAPIVVLLSTFNGERYLEEQLASLWQQTRQDFVLHVRDDGSTDTTVAILKAARQARPDRVQLVEDGQARMGPKRSFASLMRSRQARYVAFCDQDDVWLPEKLDRQVKNIEMTEQALGAEVPILCCSDAIVTDAKLQTMHASYHQRHRLRLHDGRDQALPRLLFRNYAIGATTMMNSALVRRCQHIPDAAVMHDWWVVLVATATGRVIALPEALIQYRQHSANAIGSRARGLPRSPKEFASHLAWSRLSSANCLRQAAALDAMHGAEALPESAAVLRAFADFSSLDRLTRLRRLLQVRAFKPGLALNGLHLWACVMADLGEPA